MGRRVDSWCMTALVIPLLPLCFLISCEPIELRALVEDKVIESRPLDPDITFTVTYDGNGHIGGSVPTDSTGYIPGQQVTVLGNMGALVKSDYLFVGWNTLPYGTGTSYWATDTFSMQTADVVLYAQWSSGALAIAGGGGHTVALKSDGTVWAWGYNGYGQLGDGTVTDQYSPVQVSGLSGVSAIAAGSGHTVWR